MENIYSPSTNYKVFVRCNTFNQSNFIVDSLNGFAIQKTSFPFVCMIMDDCSTDGTQDVIKSWAKENCDLQKAEYLEDQFSNIIIAMHTANPNCVFAFYFLKQNLYKRQDLKIKIYNAWRGHCEYESLCEGDDYWIIDNKLQLQVDILDNNPAVSIVYTDVNQYNEKTKETINNLLREKIKFVPKTFSEDLVHAAYISPCSWLSRLSMMYIPTKEYTDNTFVMALEAFANHDVYFLDITSATYRILEVSASHNNNLCKTYTYLKGLFDIQKEYAEKYSNLVTRDDISRIYKRGYSHLMHIAVTVRDHVFIREAKEYFGVQLPSLKMWAMVNFPSFCRTIFLIYYKIKGIEVC